MEHIQPKLYHHLHEQCHLFKKYCDAPLALSKTNEPFNFAMKCKLRAHSLTLAKKEGMISKLNSNKLTNKSSR
jgi:hypothetical protein